MFEGDDDDFKLLKKAEKNRAFDPHGLDRIKKDIQRKEKGKLTKLRRETALKQQMDKQKALKAQMAKQGVQTADQAMKTEQMIKDKEREDAASKAQGQTEQPTQAV